MIFSSQIYYQYFLSPYYYSWPTTSTGWHLWTECKEFWCPMLDSNTLVALNRAVSEQTHYVMQKTKRSSLVQHLLWEPENLHRLWWWSSPDQDSVFVVEAHSNLFSTTQDCKADTNFSWTEMCSFFSVLTEAGYRTECVEH